LKKDILHDLSVSWATQLNRYVNREGVDFQKMVLGLEIMLHNVPKMVLMVVMAFALGILPQTLAVWFPFVLLRRYASGLHASGSIRCTIVSLLMFVAIPYVLWGLYIDEAFLSIALMGTAFMMYKYAPADTAERPIIGKLKRVRLKKKAVVACCFLLALTLLFLREEFYVLIVTGAFFVVVTIMPLTYRVLRRSMNNYEKFE